MIYNTKQRRKQSNTIKGEGNPNWKGGRVTKICVRCEMPYQVYPNRKDTQTHCSLLCANRDMADAQKGSKMPSKGNIGETNGWYSKGYLKKGELNPNWKGGLTSQNGLIRASARFQEWRQAVFERDNWTCQDCRKRGGDLEAHHIRTFSEYPELRFDISNGRTLCLECHKKTFRDNKILIPTT